MSSLAVVLFCLGLFFFYWKTISDQLWKRIRIYRALHDIPGPLAIPLLGTVWQFKWKMEDLSMQFHEWTTYYRSKGQSLMKIWVGPVPTLFVLKPDAARVILESTTLITKGKEYDILIPWLGRGLLIATGDKWRTRRKMLTPSFHFNVLNDFLKVHDYQAKILVEQIEPFANTGEEFDIFPWIKRCALDIICGNCLDIQNKFTETAMGCTVSAQTNHNHQYVMSVQRMNEIAFLYQRMPWLQLKPIWWLSGVGSAYEKHLKVVTDFTKKVISDKLVEGEDELIVEDKKKAFLDMLVDLSRDGSLSYEDIREEVDTFMFEGHDTTSASMGWTLWCLAHNPDCQRKIHEELDSVFGQSDRDITVDDLKQLKYLERCVKESLRVRPSVPNFARVVEEDTVIDGVLVPRGCSIVICPLMLHFSEETWKDPFEFDPDRFVDENVAHRHPYAYIPFSAGPRNCIGQKFAVMEEKTVLAWFFRKYRVSTTIPFIDNVPLPEIILRPTLGIPVKIEKREPL